MQQQDRTEALLESKKLKLTWLPYAIFVASVATTLFAIFMLSAWVEVSGMHHAVQHVLIFVSGTAAGGSLISLRKTKKEQ